MLKDPLSWRIEPGASTLVVGGMTPEALRQEYGALQALVEVGACRQRTS